MTDEAKSIAIKARDHSLETRTHLGYRLSHAEDKIDEQAKLIESQKVVLAICGEQISALRQVAEFQNQQLDELTARIEKLEGSKKAEAA